MNQISVNGGFYFDWTYSGDRHRCAHRMLRNIVGFPTCHATTFGSWNKLSPNQAPWKGKYNYFEPNFPHGCVSVYLLIIKKWMARATASFIMIERAFCAIVLAALSGRFSLQPCDSSSTHHQKLAQNHISTRIERQSWACWYAGWRKKIPEFLFRGKRKTTSFAFPHWSASFKADVFHGSVPCLPVTATKRSFISNRPLNFFESM